MSALLKTLKLLNQCGLHDLNDTISRLWTQLRMDFGHANAAITKNQTFVTWTVHHVDLGMLCLAVEAEHEASLTRISSDLRGRLTALAARFHVTPTLFCWLFGTKLAKSRPTQKLLNDLKNVRPDLSLVDLYTRFDHVSRAEHPAFMAKTDNSIIKQAIQYFQPDLGQRKVRAGKSRAPSESRNEPPGEAELADIPEEIPVCDDGDAGSDSDGISERGSARHNEDLDVAERPARIGGFDGASNANNANNADDTATTLLPRLSSQQADTTAPHVAIMQNHRSRRPNVPPRRREPAKLYHLVEPIASLEAPRRSTVASAPSPI